jgi:hypothetical protein
MPCPFRFQRKVNPSNEAFRVSAGFMGRLPVNLSVLEMRNFDLFPQIGEKKGIPWGSLGSFKESPGD